LNINDFCWLIKIDDKGYKDQFYNNPQNELGGIMYNHPRHITNK
jgi:hypothetical protein